MADQTLFTFRLDQQTIEALGLDLALATQAVNQTMTVGWGPHEAEATVQSVAIHEDYVEVTLAIGAEQPGGEELAGLVAADPAGLSTGWYPGPAIGADAFTPDYPPTGE